ARWSGGGYSGEYPPAAPPPPLSLPPLAGGPGGEEKQTPPARKPVPSGGINAAMSGRLRHRKSYVRSSPARAAATDRNRRGRGGGSLLSYTGFINPDAMEG